MRRAFFLLSLLLVAIPASTFAHDLYQDGIIYDFKDFAVFASYWMDVNCSQSYWCNGCDFNMSDSVDFNDFGYFANYWFFITADDLAAIAARDAADAGIEHAKLYMKQSWSTASNKAAWLSAWHDPCAVTPNYSFGPEALGDTEFQYDIYKGTKPKGYEIISTGTSGSSTHSVNAAVVLRSAFFGVGVKENALFRANTDMQTIPEGEDLLIQTNSTDAGCIELKHDVHVPGDVVCGLGGDPDICIIEQTNAVIDGETRASEDYIDFPYVHDPGLTPGTWTIPDEVNEPNVAYIYNDVQLNNLTLDSSVNTLYIQGDVDIFVNGNTYLSSNTQIIVTDGSSLDLYLGGDMQANPGSEITYGGELITDAEIIEAASSISIKGTVASDGTPLCTNIHFQPIGDFYGTIYAPDASLYIAPEGDFYGAIIGESIELRPAGTFYFITSLYDLPDVELLYMGFKNSSWWEEYVGHPDKVKETFESVVRKSAYRPCQIEASSLTVYYYSVPNITGDADLEPDSFATFYLSGSHLMLDTGTIAIGVETTEILAENVTDVQFSEPTSSTNIEMAVTFTDRTINYLASRHN